MKKFSDWLGLKGKKSAVIATLKEAILPELRLLKQDQVELKKALLNLIPLPPGDYCIAHETVCFYPTARIINNLGVRSAIVIGKHTHIRGELLTFGHGGAIHIGEYCYIGEGTHIWSSKKISIGDRVLISHNVNIFDNDTHPIDDPVARHAQFKAIIASGHPPELCLNEAPVYIEDDVLIGCQAIIISGVTIGRGAVVGAGSIVTRDVPEYSIVAGNPAKVIRSISRRDE